jgi:hypothetical protein
MKKLTAILVLFTLTSCGGYENLSTPFNFSGKGINLFGSDAQQTTGESNTYEVMVNAPAGTAEIIAMSLFDQEAKRVCKGKEYSKQIVSSGTANIREFGEKGLNQSTINSIAPSLRGYVTCK